MAVVVIRISPAASSRESICSFSMFFFFRSRAAPRRGFAPGTAEEDRCALPAAAAATACRFMPCGSRALWKFLLGCGAGINPVRSKPRTADRPWYSIAHPLSLFQSPNNLSGLKWLVSEWHHPSAERRSNPNRRPSFLFERDSTCGQSLCEIAPAFYATAIVSFVYVDQNPWTIVRFYRADYVVRRNRRRRYKDSPHSATPPTPPLQLNSDAYLPTGKGPPLLADIAMRSLAELLVAARSASGNPVSPDVDRGAKRT